MSKSYKSGPRFGPNAWSWKDKAREKNENINSTQKIEQAIAVVSHEVSVIPALEQKNVLQSKAVLEQVVEEAVEVVATQTEEKIETSVVVDIEKSIVEETKPVAQEKASSKKR